MINVMVRRKMEHRVDRDRIRAVERRLRDGEAYSLCACKKGKVRYVVCDPDRDRQGTGTGQMH